ncbi:hypothetical protein L218DRAFT_948559 [Marasmius fiardii PR-910]|nr:hypothetical protein L218DRAFT_948559 [Marasmius fiardii PR-910]
MISFLLKTAALLFITGIPSSQAANNTIYIISNAETPSLNRPGLTPVGERRAQQCIPSVFTDFNIGLIISCNGTEAGSEDEDGDGQGCGASVATVQPLATKLGLTLNTCGAGDDANEECASRLINAFAKNSTAAVLVVWDNLQMDDLLENLNINDEEDDSEDNEDGTPHYDVIAVASKGERTLPLQPQLLPELGKWSSRGPTERRERWSLGQFYKRQLPYTIFVSNMSFSRQNISGGGRDICLRKIGPGAFAGSSGEQLFFERSKSANEGSAGPFELKALTVLSAKLDASVDDQILMERILLQSHNEELVNFTRVGYGFQTQNAMTYIRGRAVPTRWCRYLNYGAYTQSPSQIKFLNSKHAQPVFEMCQQCANTGYVVVGQCSYCSGRGQIPVDSWPACSFCSGNGCIRCNWSGQGGRVTTGTSNGAVSEWVYSKSEGVGYVRSIVWILLLGVT